MKSFITCTLHQYYLGDEIGRMRWAVHVAGMGEIRNAYNILVGNSGEKRPLRRTRCRWRDHIIVDFGDIS
jgi:hypothetical protein